MRFAVIYSKKDKAGINIAKQLKSFFLPQVPILDINKETIHSEKIDKHQFLQKSGFIIFASKHQSKTPRKTLSLHAPGNWREADYGGKQGKVCNTSTLILKYLFQRLHINLKKAKLDDEYEITLECTHHGPLIEKPCCFIEIGSSETEWVDERAGKVIAKTISDLQKFEKKINEYNVSIGIGGPHYCPNFNKIQLNSGYAIGHIIPEYALPLTQSILSEALEKTQEHVDYVLLDWKGLGKSDSKQEVIRLLKQLGLEFKRTSEIKK